MTTKPDSLCMAPWVHTYLSPQTERRMCCASREPAQNFQQYVDSSAGTGKYIPMTLEQHWNGDHMRSVRRRMIAGEEMPECTVCDKKLLNTSVYRDYFWHLFGHKYDDAMNSTNVDGSTTMKPLSWDYRFSNLCNFKCRMCGDMLSSAWESEEKQHKMIDWGNPQNHWMLAEVREKITEFQDTQIEAEFSQAVEEHRVEEVYWVGGEPLMFEQHWRYMKRIIELGDGKHVYARYNSNLSRISYGGVHLFNDILVHLRDWQMCASIDGTGEIGEYIRTGLNYAQWLENFQQGVNIQTNARQMRVDFTLTLPGMFETDAIQNMANSFGVDVLAKTVFAFSPDIFMSPLMLPRTLLEPWIDQLLVTATGSIRDVLLQLRSRPTFEEQWPDQYAAGVVKGKRRILQLESMRPCSINMDTILKKRPDVYEWWKSID